MFSRSDEVILSSSDRQIPNWSKDLSCASLIIWVDPDWMIVLSVWPFVPHQCCCDTLFHFMNTGIMKSIVRHLCIMWSDEVILSPSDRYMQIQRKALSYRQLDNLGWLWSYDFSPRSTLLFVKFFSHHREASSDTIHLFLIFLSPCVTLGLHLNDVNEWHMAVYLYHTREYILVRYVSKYLCNALTLTVDT